MSTRVNIISNFYDSIDEDSRLVGNRRGELEFFTTMQYIHRYSKKDSKVLEVGAGTGKYSIALAKEGMNVTAVELVESNLEVLRKNGNGIKTLTSCQGDATNLSAFDDESFDVTLVLGPMYHLYELQDVNKAIDEAVRVTKKNGVIMFAFLSVYAIMYSNYLYSNWAAGEEENFTKDYQTRHFEQQLFTGYDITEFESLFNKKPVKKITTAGTDGYLEPVQLRSDFAFSDKDFESFKKWHLAFAEKRELLGSNSHLLYICKKQNTK